MQYLITYMTSNAITVEADSEEEARDKFWSPDIINYACEELDEQPVEITDICEYE